MKNTTKIFVVLLTSLFLISCSIDDALAKGNKGKKSKAKEKQKSSQTSKSNSSDKSTPPGWSKGKKTGWGGESYPPGWSKWEKKKQNKWKTDREEALTEVTDVSDKYDIPATKQGEMTQAFDEAISGGIAINDARKKLVNALKDKQERKNLLIDTSQSVLELLR